MRVTAQKAVLGFLSIRIVTFKSLPGPPYAPPSPYRVDALHRLAVCKPASFRVRDHDGRLLRSRSRGSLQNRAS